MTVSGEVTGDLPVTGDIYTQAIVDSFNADSVVGWGAYGYGHVDVKIVGKTVFYDIRIYGTSDTNIVTIRLPFDISSSHSEDLKFPCYITDNGTGAIGRAVLDESNDNLLIFYPSATAANTDWTNSGTKEVNLQFHCEID